MLKHELEIVVLARVKEKTALGDTQYLIYLATDAAAAGILWYCT